MTGVDPDDDRSPSRQQTVSAFDPGIRAVYLLGLLVALGFAGIYLGWHHVAQTLYVDLQVPWIASCGLGGLGLIGSAVVAWHIHVGRRDDAREQQRWTHVLAAADSYAAHLEQAVREPERPRTRKRAAQR